MEVEGEKALGTVTKEKPLKKGAPYEDIAFRIFNKDWEYSHKKGFKGTFGSGILRPYFNFKRYRDRR
ncbi:hypothetical protein CRG98_022977 [Punica granatum]|uniref:Splicing factor Cactin C-terminal domain-containing protein n=1 Tax=Punica granatum TaxID=22663 RepID=A0A2I0JK05_PUNGR|nr:hypothetical protein CRG98_022977 [Punica granatum]